MTTTTDGEDDERAILITNDDGIDSQGIRALADALDDHGDVTVVAPATDQSAVGRSMSTTAELTEHELGYAVDGTPADCVVAGLTEFIDDPDLVVAGCNRGANLGHYVLGRSGTVSAAVEAAFFDVPAIATSLYIPVPEDVQFSNIQPTKADYREAATATAYLVEHTLDSAVFDHADYLNVNAPMPGDEPADMKITRPSHSYNMDATKEDGRIVLHDHIWERMAAGDVPDEPGTDRYELVNGNVSVSPLTAPHTTDHHDALDALAQTYTGE
jgi:5'-nucleotidase